MKRHVLRVLRGGSYDDAAKYLRSALRYGDVPERRGRFSGFRIVRRKKK